MKEKLEVARKRPRQGGGFYSISASSGDEEEDVYEEAYGGSDVEALQTIEDQIIVSPVRGEVAEKDDIMAQIDRLLDGTDNDKLEAHEILQKHKAKFLTDASYHWRLAKNTFQLSQIYGAEGDAEKRKEYIYMAKDIATTALGLDDQCANAHKWYAIAVGSVGEFEGTQQRILNGYKYKEHIEKAIELKPEDPSNYHLLGRWCYTVYMLSWLERKAAATLYATPPTATLEETLAHFMKAEDLNPGKWKENLLFIAKCHIEFRQYEEAVRWLEKGNKTPVVSQDDRESQAEIETLLAKYKQ